MTTVYVLVELTDPPRHSVHRTMDGARDQAAEWSEAYLHWQAIGTAARREWVALTPVYEYRIFEVEVRE